MPHIPPHPLTVEFATRAFVEDIPVHHVLTRAGVNPSTWTRMRRKGQKPQDATMERLNKALSELVAARDQAEPAGEAE